MKYLIPLMILLYQTASAQQSGTFRIDSVPATGILLDSGWKWHAGDNPEWTKPDFDDAGWKEIDPTKELVQLAHISTSSPLWLRLKISHQMPRAYALAVLQSGATELYLNGKLIQKLGQIDSNNQRNIAYNPLGEYLILNLDSLDNVLAIRYCFQKGINYGSVYNSRYHLFFARIFDSGHIPALRMSSFWPGFDMGVYLILFIVHGMLFLYYRPLKANFWYSAWAFLNALFVYFLFLLHNNPYLDQNPTYILISLILSQSAFSCLLYSIYLLLENKQRIYLFLFPATAIINLAGYYLFGYAPRDTLWFVVTIIQVLLTVAMALSANRLGDRRGMPVVYGVLVYLVFWTLFIVSYPLSWGQITKDILFHLAVLSLPITVSALLGFKFRQVNLAMLHNLEQVTQLFTEKQQILASQNETLERQVTERTTELVHKNRDLEIEAALERVRSKTMAMHKSEQLAGVMSLLCKEILNLGIRSEDMETCYITTFDVNDAVGEIYLTTSNGDLIPDPFQARYDEDYYFKQIYAAWQNGDSFLFLPAEGEELMKHFAFLYSCDAPPSIMEMRSADHVLLPTQLFNYILYFSQGYLALVTRIPVPEYQEVFKRFGNTLQQAYTRFLDLQKAEAQAEQARLNLIQIQTEKKRAEDALTILKATQNQLIQSEKLASLGELTAGIAHEIQNPLNFVNNFAEVSAEMLDEMHEELEKGDTIEAIAIATDLKTNLEKINHHGQRASSIVKGMLEHSRASTGVKEPTDLNTLADEFLRLAYHGLRAKDNSFNAKMETHFDPNLPKVSVIPQDIGRVLLNVINNAFYAVAERSRSTVHQRDVETLHATSLQHPPYQPTVSVSTKRLENAIEVRVQDNGPGIPEAIRDKIFQPFFTTKPTGQGTGLGLSLAYDILKSHGGELKIENTTDEGATFIIQLPFTNHQ